MPPWRWVSVCPAISMMVVMAIAGPALSDPPPKVVRITKPQWVSKPVGDDFVSFYPIRAMQLDQEGRVDLNCVVTVAGTLSDCMVVEANPGYGFGDATLQIARLFKMAPQTMDGQPVAGGRFATVIVWRLGSDPSPLPPTLGSGQ